MQCMLQGCTRCPLPLLWLLDRQIEPNVTFCRRSASLQRFRSVQSRTLRVHCFRHSSPRIGRNNYHAHCKQVHLSSSCSSGPVLAAVGLHGGCACSFCCCIQVYWHTGLLAITLAVSVSRTGALLRNYSAPMAVFRALPEACLSSF
jgi:hypothetical protein